MSGIAIVTGASRGIGRATAIRLARDFAGVAIVARSSEALVVTGDAIRRAGAEPLSVVQDLQTAEAAVAVVAATLQRFGRIDALACIAGAVPQAELFEITDRQWTDGLALKLHAARRLTIAAWDALVAARGSVAITSGTTALAPKALPGAVSVINAAILAMSKAFAERGISDDVQVNAILPGTIVTDRRRAMLQAYAEKHGVTLDQAERLAAADLGITRLGQPEDVAHAIAFLFAPESHWITGTAMRVDGGEIKALA